MGDITQQRDIGALVDLKRLTDHATSTAGGSGDGTTVTGNTIDREGFGNFSLPLSVVLGVIFETTLQSGVFLSVGYDVQSSPDNSTWADCQSATYAVGATGPSGRGAVKAP